MQLLIFYRNFMHINIERKFLEPTYNPYWRSDDGETTQLPYRFVGRKGEENIRRISASVPIVAVTELSYYTDQQWARQAECDDVIASPYSLDRLKERGDSFLKNR